MPGVNRRLLVRLFFLISFFRFFFPNGNKNPDAQLLLFFKLFFLPSFVFEYVETLFDFIFFKREGGKVIDFLFPLVGGGGISSLFYGYVQQPTL